VLHGLATALLILGPIAAVQDFPSLTGSWTYAAPQLRSPEGLTCSLRSAGRLTLRHEAGSLSGSFRGITLRCSAPNTELPDVSLPDAALVSASVTGREVVFSFASTDWAHTGRRLSPDLMTGRLTIRIDLGSGRYLRLSGSWSAARVSQAPAREARKGRPAIGLSLQEVTRDLDVRLDPISSRWSRLLGIARTCRVSRSRQQSRTTMVEPPPRKP